MNRRKFVVATFTSCLSGNAIVYQSAAVLAQATPSAPLRNQIKVELNAAPAEVWALVGDLSRFPEYSSGLSSVEVAKNAQGEFLSYLCHFKPREAGGESMVHREYFKWYKENEGWATAAEEPNAFGLTHSLSEVRLQKSENGTMVTFSQFYDAADLAMMKTEFDAALSDIANNLVQRFGGQVLEKLSDN